MIRSAKPLQFKWDEWNNILNSCNFCDHRDNSFFPGTTFQPCKMTISRALHSVLLFDKPWNQYRVKWIVSACEKRYPNAPYCTYCITRVSEIFCDLNTLMLLNRSRGTVNHPTLTKEMIPMPLPLLYCYGRQGGYCVCYRKHPPLFALVIPAVNLHSPFRNNFLCHDINEDERLWATPTPPTSASANSLSVHRADRWRCATDVLVGGCWRVGAGGSKGQQNHSTPVTYSWTWTSLKITAPPINLLVFHLATQQLAQRCSPACADTNFAVHCRTATLSKTLFWHECFVENVCTNSLQLTW